MSEDVPLDQNTITIEQIIQNYEEEQKRITDYFTRLAVQTEEFEPFNLDEIFNVRTDDLIDEGVWDTTISIFGTRRTGKTTLAKHILVAGQERGLIGGAAVITGSKLDQSWYDMFPYAQIYETNQALSFFAQLKKRQFYLTNLLLSGKKLPKDMPYQFTVILDDFIHDRSLARYSTELIEAFVNFRHYGVAVIVLSQYPTGVGPIIRSNSDFVVIFPQNGLAAKKTLINDHLEFLPDFRLSMSLLDKATKDFRCLIIHKTDSNLEPDEQISWFRAISYDKLAKEEGNKHCMIEIGEKNWRKKQNIESKKLRQNEQQQHMNESFNLNSGKYRISAELQNYRDIIWNAIQS